ncbi:MAG: hypothetical protein LC754_18285 [Acidobacteria bacterium]|nr:hypothetical protein [Acidobacteriota bacterium]
MRIHGWLETAQPLVFILTDGSGRSGQSRLDATARYLRRLRIKTGSVFGRFTDLEMYRAILGHEFAFFIALADELAGVFVSENIERVVGDSSEGYNTTHDICRLVINTAVELSNRRTGRRTTNYDFPVVNRPNHCPEIQRAGALWLNLDEKLFERKLAAAREFYPELFAEVEATLNGDAKGPLADYLRFKSGDDDGTASPRLSLDVFRVECLRPVSNHRSNNGAQAGETPFYEWHSERQVASGVYEHVIRYREHILPLAEALREHVERSLC